MGTVMNGNVWAGACVNGKTVSGLVKNGVVFFRKPISTYKRRIMVGDVLGGKTIYNDFKNDDSFFQEWLTSKDYSSFITSNQSTSNYDYFEFYTSSDESTYLSLAVNYPEKGEEISIYNYDNGNVTIVPKVTIRNDLNYDTVTSIVDNVAYRHLFIEDENIRPVQVGDVITRNTRFYFTIPDDIFSKTNIGTNPIRLDNGSTLSVLSHSSPKRIRFYTNNAISPANDVVVYENDKIPTNKSSMIVSPVNGNYFEGTVSRVESNSLVYNMTFVDVRTLG